MVIFGVKADILMKKSLKNGKSKIHNSFLTYTLQFDYYLDA